MLVMLREKCYTEGMHYLFLALACCALCAAEERSDWSVLLPDGSAGVTLDEEAYAAVRAEMTVGRKLTESADVAMWRRAMNAASTEERDATLLCLLQRLNPERSPEAFLPEIIELLQLHSRAAAGEASACAELSPALRCGQWHLWKLPIVSDFRPSPQR